MDYRYHAFLSYAHEDKKTVEWLRRLLSTFWVPWKRRRQIFMDQESLPAGGGLSAKLKEALEYSRFLIVCCSKDSAESRWVDLEVNEFLKSHQPENMLACLMGVKTTGPFTVPQGVQKAQDKLGDDLFKPDLRGNPERLKRRERKAAIKEALALLAPLVDLPGKDQLLDQRKKTLILGAASLSLLICGAIIWKVWDDRPASQISKILSKSPGLVRAISTDIASSKSTPPRAAAISDDATDRYSTIDEWLRTLVLTGHWNEALEAVRTMERADARFHAMIEVAEQLREKGAIRHFIDHWGHPSWEIVPDRNDGIVTAGASEQAEEAANEAVQAANAVVEASRKIEDPGSRFEVLVKVADALGRVGKGFEAKPAALEALEAGRRVEETSSRSAALVRVIETMARAAQNDNATHIATEALEAARNIKDKTSRLRALVRVAIALAAAGRCVEAQETARQIEDEDSRSSALAGIVNELVKGGRYTEGRAVAHQIKGADERTEALVMIANALAKAGTNDEAMKTADEALMMQRQIKSDFQVRLTGNAWFIELLARVGRTVEALEMARRVKDADDRSRALVRVAGVLIDAGNQVDASRAANEAVDAARQIQDPNARIGALLSMGEALANSGGSAELSRIANEGLATIGEHKSHWRMGDIVRLLIKAGKSDEARQVADSELAAREKLPPGTERTEALAGYDVPSLLSLGVKSRTSAETRQVAHAALEAAQQKKFEWEANRPPFIVRIVGALAQAGKKDEAVDAAGEIANQITRIQALVRVSEELSRARDAERAGSVIKQAEQLAQQLPIVKDKSFALAEVAKGLARLRYFRLARAAVESQSSSSDKLAAYIVIVREYSTERNPGLAKLFDPE